MNDEQYMFVFDSNEERIAHEEGDAYTEPYVSLIRGTDQVHYNSEGVEVTYLIPQGVWNGPGLYPFWAGTTTTDYPFNRILVDGKDFYDIEDLNPKTGVFFNTPGVHTIRFFLTDKTFFGNTNGRGFFENVPLMILGIKFPNTLTEIGDNLLASVENYIEHLVIPEGVTTIGNHAFPVCLKLKSLSLPSTLVSIGDAAFLAMGHENESPLNIVLPNSVTTIGTDCFQSAKIGSIILSSSLERIPERAFMDCVHLTRIVIPSSVVDIFDRAFYGDTLLSTVELFEGELDYIGIKSFFGCPINRLVIPEGVTSLGSNFITSHELETLVIPDSVTEIDGNSSSPLFREENEIIIHNLKIGSGFPFTYGYTLGIHQVGTVEYSGNTIPDYFISNNFGSVDEIKLTGSPTTIGDSAFMGFYGEYLDLPRSITTLGRGAFRECPNLKKLTIPPLVTELPPALCMENYSLEEVILPRNLVSIGDSVFTDCIFTEITLPSALTSIGVEVFPYTLKTINIPANINLQYVGTGSLTEIRWYSTLVGEVYIGKVLIKPVLDLQGRYVVKEGTTKICDKTFQNSTSLVRVTLPSTLVEIGEHAFAGCRNLSIIVSNAVEAPLAEYMAFGDGREGYAGAAGSVTPGTNKLYVPIDATGYDQDEWSVLINESKGGFQIING